MKTKQISGTTFGFFFISLVLSALIPRPQAMTGPLATPDTLTGTAAGVPFLAVPPFSAPRNEAPVVVAWHLQDPPRTKEAFAAQVPLEGLNAWRIYLGLPMSGKRLPEGGFDEIMRLGYEDAVMNLQGPISDQAAKEFGPALAELREQLGFGDGPLALVCGSMGSAVVQLILAEQDILVSAAVLISPMAQLRPVVEALGKQFGIEYPWSEPSLEVARRLDFVARAEEIASNGEPAMLFVVGQEDDADGIRNPVDELRDSLASFYEDPDRVSLEVVSGMAHALADEPGVEPAPQTPHAVAVDRLAVTWLRRSLRKSE